MAFGVDYSFSRPGGAALAAAGVTFAVRYLYPGGGKGITAGEFADLTGHGIAVAFVFEGAAGGMLGGAGQGAADAKLAVQQIAANGLPSLPVYFTADFNATAAQMGVIDAYLQGASTVLGVNRVGIYGGLNVIQHVQASKTAAWFWQTYAWSSGRWAANTHLQQYLNGQTINGGSVDYCRSMQAQFGQNAGSPVVVEDFGDEMKLIWDTAGGGYLITETGDTTVSAEEYQLLYRVINSNQALSPFSNAAAPAQTANGKPVVFNAGEVAIIATAVARTRGPISTAPGDPIDYDQLAAAFAKVVSVPTADENAAAARAAIVK